MGDEEDVFYTEGGETVEQVVPDKLCLPHHWKCSESSWMGLRATSSSGRCEGVWTWMIFKVRFQCQM